MTLSVFNNDSFISISATEVELRVEYKNKSNLFRHSPITRK